MRLSSHLTLGIICLLLSPSLSGSVFSNTRATIDSLQLVINTSGSDSIKSRASSDLAWEFVQLSLDTALIYANTSRTYAEKINDSLLIANSINTIAMVYWRKGDYEQAESLFLSSLKIGTENNFTEIVSACYNNLGILRKIAGNYEEAIEYYLKGVVVDEASNNTYGLASKNGNLGVLYYLLKDYDIGIEYFQKAALGFKELKNRRGEAVVYNNIAGIYVEQKNYNKAMQFYEQSLAINNELGDDREISRVLNNLGVVYREQGKLQKSISFSNNALKLRQSVGDPLAIAETELNIGSTYAKKKQLNLALKYLNHSLFIADSLSELNLKQEALQALSIAYFDNRKFQEAYNYHLNYESLKDSLINESSKATIDELKIKYETEKKDLQLLEQKVSIAAQKEKVVRQRLLLITSISVSILLLALLGLLFIYWQQRKKIFRQRLDAVLKEKELSNVNFLLQGEEQERTRLAKELHDGVNGSLGVIKLIASKELNEREKNKNLQEINSMLDSVSDEVREISHNLMPDTLIQLGLNEALESHLDRVNQTKVLDLDFQTYGDLSELDRSISLAVFRIVQELIINMLKHANASQGLVQINSHNHQLGLVVEDNGKGFDVFEKTKANNWGMGIQSVHSRVELLGGTIDIQSAMGTGTSININLPIQN